MWIIEVSVSAINNLWITMNIRNGKINDLKIVFKIYIN